MIKQLFFIFLLIGCSFTPKPPGPIQITILHTNDHHGRFWPNREGELGLAPRASLVKKIREEVKKLGGHVLLLDAGDVNTGTPQSDLLSAEPDFKGMSALKYDAMAVGNHEFDVPLETIFKQQHWAGFDFLSANIFYKESKKRPFKPFITKKIEGIRIAILGLTTKDTPIKTNPKNVQGLNFKDPIKIAAKIVPKLKKDHQLVIALTHMGHWENGHHGVSSPGDVTMARKVKGIDVIVGGHTQLPLFKPDIVNGTIIVQAYEWGKYLGRIDLEYFQGKLKLVDYHLIPINLKRPESKAKELAYFKGPIPDDKEVKNVLVPYYQQMEKALRAQIGFSDQVFDGDRRSVRFKETELTNLVGEALRQVTHSDVAIFNGGGIRASLPKGIIRVEDAMTVLPFRNPIVTVKMKGKELKKYIRSLLKDDRRGTGGLAHFVGVSFNYYRKKGTFKNLKINGNSLKESDTYQLAVADFLAQGGDKFPKLSNHPGYRPTSYTDGEVLAEFIKKHPDLKAKKYGPFGKYQVFD